MRFVKRTTQGGVRVTTEAEYVGPEDAPIEQQLNALNDVMQIVPDKKPGG